MKQCTIARPISFSGVGLHSGKKTDVCLRPSPENSGICFKLVIKGDAVSVPAIWPNVVDSRRKLSLAANGAQLDSVEHILSALYGLGVDNCLIEVRGEEFPATDGAAQFFVDMIRTAGIVSFASEQNFLKVRQDLKVCSDIGSITFVPADSTVIDCAVIYSCSAIGEQHIAYDIDLADYETQIAPARTFAVWDDVASLWRHGLALGGSFANTDVYDERGSLNERAPLSNACARHKVLDLMGALALLGGRVQGRIRSICGGHGLDMAFVRALAARIEE